MKAERRRKYASAGDDGVGSSEDHEGAQRGSDESDPTQRLHNQPHLVYTSPSNQEI